MTVIFTAAANADLDDILFYTKQNYPNQLLPLEQRIREVIARVERRPLSARAVSQRPVYMWFRCFAIHF